MGKKGTTVEGGLAGLGAAIEAQGKQAAAPAPEAAPAKAPAAKAEKKPAQPPAPKKKAAPAPAPASEVKKAAPRSARQERQASATTPQRVETAPEAARRVMREAQELRDREYRDATALFEETRAGIQEIDGGDPRIQKLPETKALRAKLFKANEGALREMTQYEYHMLLPDLAAELQRIDAARAGNMEDEDLKRRAHEVNELINDIDDRAAQFKIGEYAVKKEKKAAAPTEVAPEPAPKAEVAPAPAEPKVEELDTDTLIAKERERREAEITAAQAELAGIEPDIAKLSAIPKRERTLAMQQRLDQLEARSLELKKALPAAEAVVEQTPDLGPEAKKYLGAIEKVRKSATGLRELSEGFLNEKAAVVAANAEIARNHETVEATFTALRDDINEKLKALPDYMKDALSAAVGSKRAPKDAGQLTKLKMWFDAWKGKVKPGFWRKNFGDWDYEKIQELEAMAEDPRIAEMEALEQQNDEIRLRGVSSEQEQHRYITKIEEYASAMANEVPAVPEGLTKDEQAAIKATFDEINREMNLVKLPSEVSRAASRNVEKFFKNMGHERDLASGKMTPEQAREKKAAEHVPEVMKLSEDVDIEFRLLDLAKSYGSALQGMKKESPHYAETWAKKHALEFLAHRKYVAKGFFMADIQKAAKRDLGAELDRATIEEAWAHAFQINRDTALAAA